MRLHLKKLTDAIGAEADAEKQLDASRASRQAAEALQVEWRERHHHFTLLQRSLATAGADPLAYVAARDREEFTGQELMLLRNTIKIGERYQEEQRNFVFSLGLYPQDGTDEPQVGALVRAKTTLEAIHEAPVFIALKAKAEAYATRRTAELAAELDATALELSAWGEANGAPAEELAFVLTHKKQTA